MARAARSHESDREAPAPLGCMAVGTHTHTRRGTHSDTSIHIKQKCTYTHMQTFYEDARKSTGIHTPVCAHTQHMQPRRWTGPRMNSQTAPEVRGGKREREEKKKRSC